MMAMPTVAETREVVWTGAGRGVQPQDRGRPVKVVNLRTLARRPSAPSEPREGGREYAHRWVVRGHWRQQAHGPGRSLRRTTWVPPHVKGPEGAPFLPAETVFVWRR